jgi:hypothetical protein
MKFVKLEYRQEISISDDAYAQIATLVVTGRVCKFCEHGYTEENPCVVRNTCLSCFLRRETSNKLTFVGELWESSSGDKTYKFLDPHGYVYLSYSSNESNEVRQSNHQTILHWGFPVPETYTLKDKEKRLDPYYWHLYGGFRSAHAIVIEYRESHGDHLEVAFLAYKDDKLVELNKRRKQIQQLFKQAREKAEATKDTRGAYHPYEDSDLTTYQLYDSHLYMLISQIVSEEIASLQQDSLDAFEQRFIETGMTESHDALP